MEISDMPIYLARMQRCLFDKMFFIDKLFEPVSFVVDYGCADGSLIQALRSITDDYQCVGYDISEEMIRLARSGQPDVFFTADWSEIGVPPGRTMLNLSSVIHEVYSYGTGADIALFWDRVFQSGFRYIAVRDMMFADRDDGMSDAKDAAVLREQKSLSGLLSDFESVWGPVTRKKNLAHFLLKYKYVENWDRELHENYFPLSLEEFTGRIPDRYRVTYLEHCPLPFLAWQIRKDLGIELTVPTHLKLMLELKQ